MIRRLFLPILFLSAAAVSLAAGPSLPELFRKSKEQFRLADYSRTLSTLDQIERLALLPENAKYRDELRPALAFYRGAALAALDRPVEAREQFEIYLALHRPVVLDPATYPRKVIAAMLEAQTAVAAGGARMPRQVFDAEAPPYRPQLSEAGEDWARGPVGALLTAEERSRYETLSDPVSRSEFVTNFWRARDPKPETPENEFRDEFERRVAFADANFSQDETRGSLTDRGVVFLVLGSPTYVGRKPLTTGEDSSDPAGLSMYSRNDINAALAAGRGSTVIWDRMTGPGTKLPSSESNWREIWHYRKAELPKGVPYQQVDLEFITRRGYGKNVLQRDEAALNTLAAGRDATRGGRRK
ncbi:MAG TPA: GWxTD domain-containing protein [Thermoanaerobaculia bacterium]|nr:GWxTD domain-containing protein [Thermoanaerobaculia bacterium]